MLQGEPRRQKPEAVGRRRHDVKDFSAAFAVKVAMGNSLGVVTQKSFPEIQGDHDAVVPQEFQRVVDRGPGHAGIVLQERLVNDIHRGVSLHPPQVMEHTDPLNRGTDLMSCEDCRRVSHNNPSGSGGFP